MKPPKKPDTKPPMRIQTAQDWSLFHKIQREWQEYEENKKEYERRVGRDNGGKKGNSKSLPVA